jgi:hypothetical protein
MSTYPVNVHVKACLHGFNAHAALYNEALLLIRSTATAALLPATSSNLPVRK